MQWQKKLELISINFKLRFCILVAIQKVLRTQNKPNNMAKIGSLHL